MQRILALLTALLCFWAATSQAESVSVYGVPLQVDSVSSLDSKTVKIGVLGESRIIDRADLPHFLVGKLLGSETHAASYQVAQLATICKQALEAGDVDSAKVAYLALLKRGESSKGVFEGVVAELLRNQSFSNLASQILKELSGDLSGEGVVELILNLSTEILSDRRQELENFAIAKSTSLPGIVLNMYTQSVAIKDFSRAEKIWNAATVLLQRDQLVELANIRDPLIATLTAQKNLDAGRILDLRHALSHDAPKELVAVMTDALQTLASDALNKGRFAESLNILTAVDPNSITPTTHDLAFAALNGAVKNGIEGEQLISAIPVSLMMRTLSQSNPKIASTYLGLLEETIRRGHGDRIGEFALNELLKIRPDPSAANDELRLSLGIAEMLGGDVVFGRALISGIKTPLSVGARLRLLLSGYFISLWVLIPAFLLSIGFAAVGVLKSRASQISEGRDTARRVSEGESGFRGTQNAGGQSEAELEYLGLLREFGLRADATLKQIKGVYRNKVKVHHPDSIGSEKSLDDFLIINERYEKLLTLHEQLGKK